MADLWCIENSWIKNTASKCCVWADIKYRWLPTLEFRVAKFARRAHVCARRAHVAHGPRRPTAENCMDLPGVGGQ